MLLGRRERGSNLPMALLRVLASRTRSGARKRTVPRALNKVLATMHSQDVVQVAWLTAPHSLR